MYACRVSSLNSACAAFAWIQDSGPEVALRGCWAQRVEGLRQSCGLRGRNCSFRSQGLVFRVVDCVGSRPIPPLCETVEFDAQHCNCYPRRLKALAKSNLKHPANATSRESIRLKLETLRVGWRASVITVSPKPRHPLQIPNRVELI